MKKNNKKKKKKKNGVWILLPNDPAGDHHDGFAHGDEEVEERLALGSHPAERDAQHGGKDDESEDIGGVLVVG